MAGAMREAHKLFGNDLGIHVAGGKGATSRKTPREIEGPYFRLGAPNRSNLLEPGDKLLDVVGIGRRYRRLRAGAESESKESAVSTLRSRTLPDR